MKYILEGSCLLPRRALMQEYFHLGWLTCVQCTSSLTSHSANKIHWWINYLLASKGSQKMKVKNWTYFKKWHYMKNRLFSQIANHRFSKMWNVRQFYLKKIWLPFLLAYFASDGKNIFIKERQSFNSYLGKCQQYSTCLVQVYMPIWIQCICPCSVCSSFVTEEAKLFWTVVNIKLIQWFLVFHSCKYGVCFLWRHLILLNVSYAWLILLMQ